MLRIILVMLAAALMAVLQVGLGHLLPSELALVSPVTAFCIWLIIDADLKDAVMAAVAAGIVMDTVSSMPTGLITIALVGTVLVAEILFAQVFTNQSVAAAVGLQIGTFFAYQIIWGFFQSARYVIFGWSLSGIGLISGGRQLVIGLAVQLMTVIALIWFSRHLRTVFSSVLMIASRPSRS